MPFWKRVTDRFRPKSSLFLGLPAEIRRDIYLAVFGPEKVHLDFDGRGFSHTRCSSAHEACHRGRRSSEDTDRGINNGVSNGNRPRRRRWVLMRKSRREPLSCRYPLFLVNKQISAESRDAFYSNLVFLPEDFETFVSFARNVPKNVLASIRHLEATWVGLACLTMPPVPPSHPQYQSYEDYTVFSDNDYTDFWRFVAEDMPSLTHLQFTMDFYGQYLSRALDANWHRPLQEVRGLKEFKLAIDDRMSGTEQAEADMAVLRDHLVAIVCQDRSDAAVEEEDNGDGAA